MTANPARPSHANLWDALAAAQADMVNPPLTRVNPHFKSRYADLPAVIGAVCPPLRAHGLALTQLVDLHPDTKEPVLVTVLAHGATGQVERGYYPLKPAKGDPQGFGSAVTFAKRYALLALGCVVGEDDDDGNAASAPQTVAAPQLTAQALARMIDSAGDVRGLKSAGGLIHDTAHKLGEGNVAALRARYAARLEQLAPAPPPVQQAPPPALPAAANGKAAPK